MEVNKKVKGSSAPSTKRPRFGGKSRVMGQKKKGTPGKLKIRDKNKKPRKLSQSELEIRRKQVLSLRMRGLGIRAIAKELGTGYMTVKRDLEALRSEMQERLTKLDRDCIIANSVSVFEEVESQAWDQYHKPSCDNKTKVQYLNMVRAARNDQVKLLTDIGMIAKAPQEVKHTVKSDVISHWTPQAQDIVAMAIVKAGLTPGLAPVPEDRQIEGKSVIDVEPDKK